MWVMLLIFGFAAFLWLEACRDDDDVTYSDNHVADIDDVDTSDTSHFNVDPVAQQQHNMIYGDFSDD